MIQRKNPKKPKRRSNLKNEDLSLQNTEGRLTYDQLTKK
jgi:hypothetical protein